MIEIPSFRAVSIVFKQKIATLAAPMYSSGSSCVEAIGKMICDTPSFKLKFPSLAKRLGEAEADSPLV